MRLHDEKKVGKEGKKEEISRTRHDLNPPTLSRVLCRSASIAVLITICYIIGGP